MKGRTMLLISGSEKIPKPEKHRPLTSIIQVCKRSPVGARGFEPPTSCTPFIGKGVYSVLLRPLCTLRSLFPPLLHTKWERRL